MMKVSEPELEMSEAYQNKIVPMMTRAKTYGQTHDDWSVITQLTSKPGKQKSEEQSGANGKVRVGENKGTSSDKRINKGNP
eukprot:12777686-Ditylum_brightwellii.AAC.1